MERNGKDKNVSGQDTFQHSSGWYSGCGKTCFTQSVLTDHIDELFVDIPLIVVYCYGRQEAKFSFLRKSKIIFVKVCQTLNN